MGSKDDGTRIQAPLLADRYRIKAEYIALSADGRILLAVNGARLIYRLKLRTLFFFELLKYCMYFDCL